MVNKYWIKTKEGEYWCYTKMKSVGSPDIPSSYRTQGYWSKFNESYDIKRRAKYLWIFGKLELFMMKLLAPDIRAELQLSKENGK